MKGLPDRFQITNTYNGDVFTLKNASGTGTADDPYRWTIENVPDKTEIIFTESGYDVTGYDVTINGQATTLNLKEHPFRSPEQTLMEKKLPLLSGHLVMMERTKMEQSRHIQ